MLLTTLADQLNDAVDRLPLPDMIQPTPALAEILADEIREVGRLLNHLASESAFRVRAGNREPLPPAAHLRQTTTALAGAAEPVSTALRDLGAAVSCLDRADACRHRPAGPARERALAFAQEGLLWTIGNARQRLVHAATLLRTAAVPRDATPVRRPQQAKGRAR